MASIFTRLGSYDASFVSDYSANTVTNLNYMPPLLDDWQVTDIANSDYNGYYQNPVATITTNIWNTSNTVNTASVGITGNVILYPTDYAAITLSISNTHNILNNVSTITANSYLYLTNRLSNITPVGNDTTTPHYTTALGVGQMLVYLTNQTDGVQNNAPIIGNFTSIMIANTLTSLYNDFSSNATIFLSSISGSTSNISLSQAHMLENSANNINETMRRYYNDNVLFYHNSYQVMMEMSSAQTLSSKKIGETERMLLNNYVGTSKLTSRINS